MTTQGKLQMRRGFHNIIVWVVLHLSLWFFSASPAGASHGYNPQFLDALFQQIANKTLQEPRTGVLYNITLPWKYSGMQVSVVRLRSASFWVRGANFSSFDIPPRTIPRPYVKRIAIMYQNLHNWSTHYYHVPGYRLVAPVIGFMAFDASNSSGVGSQQLDLSVTGYPITVGFPPVLLEEGNKTVTCVNFGNNGTVVLSNMTSPNLCVAQGQGHYSLAIRIPPVPPEVKEKGKVSWRWWVLGFVGGFFVAVLAGLFVLAIYKMVMRNKIRGMEKESEKGIPFDMVWIGRSRMPSASMIRTQPALEVNEVVS